MIASLYPFAKKWSEKGSVYVFSDPHFDDIDCKLMDENWISPQEQIKTIKKLCHKNDTLIILGDIGNPEYLKEIKSYKVLITGNHDLGLSNYQPYFDEMYDGPLFISDKILLSHEPVFLPFIYNIHGHNHNGEYYDEFHLNVAANACNYTPISLGKLIESGVLKKVPSIHRLAIDKQKSKTFLKTESKSKEKPIKKQEKDKDQLNFFCSCGCGSGLSVTILDGLAYLTFVSDDFYTRQFPSVYSLFESFKKKIRIKNKILKDICITYYDLKCLLKFLKENVSSYEETDNDSILAIDIEDDIPDTVFLELVQRKTLVPWKKFLAYQMVMNKRDVKQFIFRTKKNIKKEQTIGGCASYFFIQILDSFSLFFHNIEESFIAR